MASLLPQASSSGKVCSSWASAVEARAPIATTTVPMIRSKRMRERKIYFNRQQFTSTRDKPTRAQSIIARAAMGKIYLPKHAPWVEDLVSVLLRFPYGRVDDDVCSAYSAGCSTQWRLQAGGLRTDGRANRPTAPLFKTWMADMPFLYFDREHVLADNDAATILDVRIQFNKVDTFFEPALGSTARHPCATIPSIGVWIPSGRRKTH